VPPLDARVALATIVADVTDRAAVEAALGTVAIELGAIGILVLSPNGGTVFPG
jgi:NAD(P)-dependent dehydrogenase (short-subunit alcohol dehydrogenase family)